MSQPASRTRFYRNKRDGKVLGVCAGIADYTGIDVNMVRLMFLFSLFISGGSILPVYFIAGFMAPDRPYELDSETADERRFWQGVRASPGRSARAIGSRLKDIDRRLGDIEHYVTTENRSLAREIDSLR
ncbi:envelope stress response membrane protein PspC [Sphingomonas sp. HDW15A]|uniref:envelope stress response membrane protein PspC n=1 Tax=Sphingomonas sp. HDW15A TaxID=2714942 RepID=UPI0014095661|nr:envelope stress response membrane protein PspC [Sphingomonas sp. HDW15A]QIK95940.1 envelope stress response membrane protein PspC [Sphingomonas sp. HDW15A]